MVIGKTGDKYLTFRESTRIYLEKSFHSETTPTVLKELVIYCSLDRDLNRGYLVYMFSLRFSGSKFLINSRRQFRVRKIFSCT